MQKITVHTGRPYDILIDDGLLEQAGDLVRRVSGAKRICLISDSNVYPLYGNRCRRSPNSCFPQGWVL